MKFVNCCGLGVALLLMAGCAHLPLKEAGTTSIKFTGDNGAGFTGYYVKDGQRVKVLGTSPWSFSSAGISSFEIRKVQASDNAQIELHYESPYTDSTDGMSLGPGIAGASGIVHSGFTLTTIAD